MREIENAAGPAEAPAGAPLETWDDVAAISPSWRPGPGETELRPVAGRLELHAQALVFRADDTFDRSTRAPVVGVIDAADVGAIGPLSPGTSATPTQKAGSWMPGWQRRFRVPGFAVETTAGPWLFDSPHGKQRADALARRYGAG
jgi:hypothetical protein